MFPPQQSCQGDERKNKDSESAQCPPSSPTALLKARPPNSSNPIDQKRSNSSFEHININNTSKIPISEIPNLGEFSQNSSYSFDQVSPSNDSFNFFDNKIDEDRTSDLNSVYLKKNANFHLLFRNIPINELLIEDYGCALQRDILVQGRLYITNNYLGFYSNIFGWVTNLTINFEEIVSIEKKNSALIIPNAIRISTLHTKRVFTSFIYRDTAYSLICDLWKKSKSNPNFLDHESPSQVDFDHSDSDNINIFDNESDHTKKDVPDSYNTLSNSSDSLVPSGSDPIDLSKELYLIKLNQINMFLDEARTVSPQDTPNSAYSLNFNVGNDASSSKKIKPHDDGLSDTNLSETQTSEMPKSSEYLSNNINCRKSLSRSIPINSSKIYHTKSKSTNDYFPTFKSGTTLNRFPDDNKSKSIMITQSPKTLPDGETGTFLKSDSKLSIPNFPTNCPCGNNNSNIRNHYKNQLYDGAFQIPMPILVRLIFFGLSCSSESENLKYGFDFSKVDLAELDNWKNKYLESQEIKEIEFTNWPVIEKGHCPTQVSTAQIKYTKPLNFSIGPKKALTFENCNLIYFDLSDSIVVDVHVTTPEVPAGGNFTVLIRYCFTWHTTSPNENENDKDTVIGLTKVVISFEIEWSKSSWIKGPVESNTLETLNSASIHLSKKINAFIDSHPNVKSNFSPTVLVNPLHFKNSGSSAGTYTAGLRKHPHFPPLNSGYETLGISDVCDRFINDAELNKTNNLNNFISRDISSRDQTRLNYRSKSPTPNIMSKNKANSKYKAKYGSSNIGIKNADSLKLHIDDVKSVDDSFFGQLKQPLYNWLSDPSHSSTRKINRYLLPASLYLIGMCFLTFVGLYALKDTIFNSILKIGEVFKLDLFCGYLVTGDNGVPAAKSMGININSLNSGIDNSLAVIYRNPPLAILLDIGIIIFKSITFPLSYIFYYILGKSQGNKHIYSQSKDKTIKNHLFKDNEYINSGSESKNPDSKVDTKVGSERTETRKFHEQINKLNRRLDVTNDLLNKVLQMYGNERNLEHYF
ncbi:putative membrane protein [Smittium culicis]|uniref:Putative membrane protein n=1 Tax=Smittium culicis TaxID=133412 RepID=A0A1R1Y5A5_9FUNG|nr:putative membrane protein [Smittium culicis]